MDQSYPEFFSGSTWEVDWAHPGNTGTYVWARNLHSHIPSGREWHFVSTGALRRAGVNTPTYRADSWEVDWDKRNGKKVWARNTHSKMPGARDWHWVDFNTLNRSGVKWKPKDCRKKRHMGGDGYITVYMPGMTEEDIALVDKHGLWKQGRRKQGITEHRLVALKKYGAIPEGHVVRHVNGDKTDNRPENLVLGTPKENAWDHQTAQRMAMYWRCQYEDAQAEIEHLRGLLGEGQ